MYLICSQCYFISQTTCFLLTSYSRNCLYRPSGIYNTCQTTSPLIAYTRPIPGQQNMCHTYHELRHNSMSSDVTYIMNSDTTQ
ncbi:hypothetical protein F383_10063 [Gossypium arboreum]|uniref:Uncharacterized protein n=1 Tax=Gossypium arboreum TaxID=29729 RepID=A0A0B0PR84_GOSAR|nr:hypothetical protein F383_10063 [Gossypium arboreum]